MINVDNLIGTEDVAKLVGVSRVTVWRWKRDRVGPPHYELPNGTAKYDREEVKRWIERKYVK